MKKLTLLWLIALILSPLVKAGSDTPHDIGITNKERILYWLNKRDKIASSELDESYRAYISNQQPNKQKFIKNGFKSFNYFSLESKNVTKNNSAFTTSLIPDQQVNNVKVLAILIDFPDLRYNDNKLTVQDTDMFYTDYANEHYQQMLFGNEGYRGPQGQTLSTAANYYRAASGDSLNFKGHVYGWVTANNNAKIYGERLGTTRDTDAPALVKEAVEKAVEKYNINLADYDLTDLDDIDGDGIINEPNGVIDHVMVFHSSIGEESGGGVLGTDAIWSHRYYVLNEQSQPTKIKGSDIKLSGYTINPIDAGIGVVVHEFGHDLGLKDEYDLQSNTVGEPVASWSVMSAGSWAGAPRGSQPVMFSPYALEYLQERYSGNWVNQLTLDMNEVNAHAQQTLVNSSSTEQSQSQIKVKLPSRLEQFKRPIEGDFQYYSNTGDNLNTSLSNIINLPATSEEITLKFIAHYSIERDYDLVQVKVNGIPIAGNYTHAINPFYGDIGPYISGDSFLNADARQPNGYLIHQFNLSAYAGQRINLQIQYLTDADKHYYGFVVDDMRIEKNGVVIWRNNAEQQSDISLSGFSKVGRYVYAPDAYYYLQLRDRSGIDSGLQTSQYSPGLLLWYSDESHSDNNTTEHPGEGFALVVDADQRVINQGASQTPADTAIQIRDAAFSLYEQRAGLGDNDLSAIDNFSDYDDYSFPIQQASGAKLPKVGFGFSIISQAPENDNIELLLSYKSENGINYKLSNLDAMFNINGLTLSPSDKFIWDFGDGSTSNELSPLHQYANYGSYTVTFTAKNDLDEQTVSIELNILEPMTLNDIEYQLNDGELNAKGVFKGGDAPYTFNWQVGDGNSVNTQQLAYRYSYSGDYNLTLTITDNQNTAVSRTELITVNVPLKVVTHFTANDLSVQFDADIIGGYKNYTYNWDFGDATASSTVKKPNHNYQKAGTYKVVLIVTDTKTNDVVTQELSVTVQKQQSSDGSSSGGSFAGLLSLLLLGLIRYKRHQ